MFDHTVLHRDSVFQAMDFRFSGNENILGPHYAPQNLKNVPMAKKWPNLHVPTIKGHIFGHTALHRDGVFQAMDFRFSGNENVQWPQYAPQNLKNVSMA